MNPDAAGKATGIALGADARDRARIPAFAAILAHIVPLSQPRVGEREMRMLPSSCPPHSLGLRKLKNGVFEI